jgi:hypothetical protein
MVRLGIPAVPDIRSQKPRHSERSRGISAPGAHRTLKKKRSLDKLGMTMGGDDVPDTNTVTDRSG